MSLKFCGRLKSYPSVQTCGWLHGGLRWIGLNLTNFSDDDGLKGLNLFTKDQIFLHWTTQRSNCFSRALFRRTKLFPLFRKTQNRLKVISKISWASPAISQQVEIDDSYADPIFRSDAFRLSWCNTFPVSGVLFAIFILKSASPVAF